MRLKTNFAVLFAAAALGLVGSAAQAGPGGVGSLKGISEPTAIEVSYRKCWWQDGERVCRRAKSSRSSNTYVDVGTRRPEEFRTGSAEWWRAMDRQGRGGFGRN